MPLTTFLLTPDGTVGLEEAVRADLRADPTGAIQWQDGDVELLQKQVVDHLDDLWAYLLNLVEEAAERGASETMYPGTPVRIAFEPAPPRIRVPHLRVSVADRESSRSAVLPWPAVVRELTDGAAAYARAMAVLSPRHALAYQRLGERAEALASLAESGPAVSRRARSR